MPTTRPAPPLDPERRSTTDAPEGAATGEGRRALGIAPFRWFWLGQSISVLGDRVYAVALPFLVFELGGGAVEVGRLFTAFAIPQLVFLLAGGVLVDRLSRRLTLIATDVFRALLLGLVLVLLARGGLQLVHLYVLSGLFGLASAFFMPATSSIVPELVPRTHLTSANALKAFSQELAGILGPPLGGLLVSTGGLALALGVDAATFVLGVGCLLLVRASPRSRAEAPEEGSYVRALREGFGYVLATTWLWVTIALFAIVNVFVAGAVTVLLPALAETRFGGAGAYGLLLSAMGAGALLGTFLCGPFQRRLPRGPLAYGGVVVAGVALVGIAIAPSLAGGMAALAVLGTSLTVFGVVWEATVQERVPQGMLGRVISIDMLGSFALLPAGYLLLGEATRWAPLGTVALACGVGTVLLALAGLCVPGVRRLE